MCYASPGPRCSNDATLDLIKAQDALESLKADPDATEEQLEAAELKVRETHDAWLKTPVGFEFLERKADQADNPERAEEFLAFREIMKNERKAAIEAYKAAVAAGDLEDEGNVEHNIEGHLYGEPDDSYDPTDPNYGELNDRVQEIVNNPELYKAEHEDWLAAGESLRKEMSLRKKALEFLPSAVAARTIVEELREKDDAPVYSACDSLKDEDREAIIADIEKYSAEGNLEALEEVIDSRIHDERFATAVALRNEERDAHYAAESAYQYLKETYKGEPLMRDVREEEAEWSEVREAGLIALDEYERVAVLESNLNDYKAVTARAVARAEALRELNELDPVNFHYEEPTLNQLEAIDTYESGSREWLESRQNGVGGSDIGKILKVDRDATIARQNYEEILKSKVEDISEEQVEEQSGEGFDTYSGRGNAWETAILRQYQKENPDENIIQCKTSWKSKEWEHMYANFDGLLTDDEGKIDGILEIKTGSNKDKWGPESAGIDGLPPQYQTQTLWYARAAGVKRVKLAALIDDTDLRVYEYEIDEELEARQDNMLSAAKNFWDIVEVSKEEGLPDPEKRRVGVPRAAIQAQSWNNQGRRTVLNNTTAFRQQSKAEVMDAYYQALGTYEENTVTPEEKEAAMRSLYTEFNPEDRKKPLIGLDLEVTGFSPTRGRIIEAGVSVMEYDKNSKNYVQTEGMDRLYGLNRKAREGKGTGAEDIHQISLDMIKDKRTFEDPENQRQLLEQLKKGTLVAHNAPFEDNWLRMHLKGYAEARDKGEIDIIDTLMASRHVLGDNHDMPNHKLESLVKRYGDEYENSHRAKADTNMMMRALGKLENEMGEKLRDENRREMETARENGEIAAEQLRESLAGMSAR